MKLQGQCHCGRIKYEMPDEVLHHALCHCSTAVAMQVLRWWAGRWCLPIR
jgi:hypothetical protein